MTPQPHPEKTSPPPIALLLMLLVPLLLTPTLSGCKDSTSTPPQHAPVSSPAHTSEITEPMTGARLRIEMPQTETDLAGLIVVHATLQWSQGVSVQLIVPDWDDTNWQRVQEHRDEITFDGSTFSQRTTFQLEPFLGGQYQIPSIGMRASSPKAGRRIARLQPIDIIVHSALTDTDDQTMAPPIGLLEPTQIQQKSNQSWLLYGGLTLAFLSGTIALLIRARSKAPEPQPLNPKAILAKAASEADPSAESLASLHRALIQLSTDHPTLEPISHEIERLRFSGIAIDQSQVQSTAKRAINLCQSGGQHQ